MSRRTLLYGLAALLGGCAGESSGPESATPELRILTDTSTLLPTPVPEEVVVDRGTWATVETRGAELGVRVAGSAERGDLPAVGRPPARRRRTNVA